MRVVLSILTIFNGLWLVAPVICRYSVHFDGETHELVQWIQTLGFFQLLELPRFTLGASLVLLGAFMYRGARIAWSFSVFALFLLVVLDATLGQAFYFHGLYSFTLLLLLIRSWRRFPAHSLTNTAVVALISIVTLSVYSVLGAIYLGEHFLPEITDPLQALYFSIVSMATVGYGDIVPITTVARAFSISIIVFGVAIFTTSVVYLVGVAATDTREIVQKRLSQMKDHYVIVGSSMLALFIYKGLKKRDLQVVVVCESEKRDVFPSDAIVITGDTSAVDTLNKASVCDATCVMAVGESDIANTYTVLAAKEISGGQVKTVTVINDEKNRKNLELLHTNYVFSLAEISSEVLMKYLSGENINNDIIADLLLSHSHKL